MRASPRSQRRRLPHHDRVEVGSEFRLRGDPIVPLVEACALDEVPHAGVEAVCFLVVFVVAEQPLDDGGFDLFVHGVGRGAVEGRGEVVDVVAVDIDEVVACMCELVVGVWGGSWGEPYGQSVGARGPCRVLVRSAREKVPA